MKVKPHRRIWLQYDPEGETTWCQDKINDDDVEYVKAKEIDEDLLLTSLALGRAEGLLYRIAAKLDEITEATAGIWVYLQVHGMEYSGPQYGEDLEAIKQFLKERRDAYARSERAAGNGPLHGGDGEEEKEDGGSTEHSTSAPEAGGDDEEGAQE